MNVNKILVRYNWNQHNVVITIKIFAFLILFLFDGLCCAETNQFKEKVTLPKLSVSGTVYEPVSDAWYEELFKKLESSESLKDFENIFRNTVVPPKEPAANVIVTAQSHSLKVEAVTDSEGKYMITDLPRNFYTISATKTSGVWSYAKKNIELNCNNRINLNLQNDLITVKGRIVDGKGQPVGNMKVKGTTAPFTVPEAGGPTSPECDYDTTDSNGCYELSYFKPIHFYSAFRYMLSGIANLDGFYVDIDTLGTSIRVPLATKKQIELGRRFLNAYNHVAEKTGDKTLSEASKLSFPFAESKGNFLIIPDICSTHPSKIIEAATKFSEKQTDIKNRTCKFDSGNIEWIKLVSQPDKKVAHGIMANELNGKNYQSIKFELKEVMLGGDFWVFVDICSGEVITHYGEQ